MCGTRHAFPSWISLDPEMKPWVTDAGGACLVPLGVCLRRRGRERGLIPER